jgi:hypothetical protein
MKYKLKNWTINLLGKDLSNFKAIQNEENFILIQDESYYLIFLSVSDDDKMIIRNVDSSVQVRFYFEKKEIDLLVKED